MNTHVLERLIVDANIVRLRPGSNNEIYRMITDGGELINLTNNPPSESKLFWFLKHPERSITLFHLHHRVLTAVDTEPKDIRSGIMPGSIEHAFGGRDLLQIDLGIQDLFLF